MKKIIAIMLIVVMLLSMVACTVCEAYASPNVEDERFEYVTTLVDIRGYEIYLFYDTETRVQYMGNEFYLCPYYDSEGNITFYEGD